MTKNQNALWQRLANRKKAKCSLALFTPYGFGTRFSIALDFNIQ